MRKLHLLISVIITTVFFIFLFNQHNPENILKLLQDSFGHWRIKLFIFLALFGLILRAFRYKLLLAYILDQQQIPSFRRILVATGIRNAFVDLLPARLGELSLVYAFNRYGIPLIEGAMTFGLAIVIDLLVLFLLLIGLISFELLHNSIDLLANLGTPLSLLIITAGVSFILIAAFAFWFLDKIMLYISSLVEKTSYLNIANHLKQIATSINSAKQTHLYLSLFLLTATLRCVKYLGLYLVYTAVFSTAGILGSSSSIPLSLIFSAFLLAEAAASLPISGVMGFGLYETVWGSVFSLGNQSKTIVTSAIFTTHVITQIVGYSIGLICSLIFLWDQRPKGSCCDKQCSVPNPQTKSTE